MSEFKNTLGFDPDQLAKDADAFFAQLGGMYQASAAITARAESPDRRVAVEYSSSEGVRALDIDPRAMRSSAGELAGTILGLIREAQRMVETQSQEQVTKFLEDNSLVKDRDAIGQQLRNATTAVQENLSNAAETMEKLQNMLRR
jgi:DNA-binding protein YbaB